MFQRKDALAACLSPGQAKETFPVFFLRSLHQPWEATENAKVYQVPLKPRTCLGRISPCCPGVTLLDLTDIRMNQLMKDEPSFGSSRTDKVRDPDQSHVELLSGFRHAEEILKALNGYQQEGVFTDVVLRMDGQEFPCHRATLSAHSAYFQAMFSGGLRESGQDTINLQKIPALSMSLALDYMYGGKVLIQEFNVEGLLELSSVLQIPKLKESCVTFLEGHLHPCNCLAMRRLANSFSISTLAEKSKKLMLEGFVEVSHHEEFLELDVQALEGYLSSEWLAVPKEEVVFEAMMRWVRHDIPTRKEALGHLLEHIRLPLMDPLYFLEKVEMDELIQGTKACRPFLQEARKHYILGAEVHSLRSRPRRFMERAEMIAVIGGCDKKGLLRIPFVDGFYPGNGQWKPLPNLPGYTKSEFAVCTLKNDIYLSGGHTHSKEVWRLSSLLNIWLKMACLQKGRWRHRMAPLQGKIYAVGGYDGFCRLASVEGYDPFSNHWETLPPLPEAVSSAAVAPCLNKLYVIGGAVDDGASTSMVQCYNPKDNEWKLLAPAPFSQRCINAVTLDNRIYVAGGLLCQIFCYQPQGDTWSRVASLPGPLESCGVTACDGKIYILGGRDENGEGTDRVFAFDAATDKLEPQPLLQRCTSNHGCVTILRNTSR